MEVCSLGSLFPSEGHLLLPRFTQLFQYLPEVAFALSLKVFKAGFKMVLKVVDVVPELGLKAFAVVFELGLEAFAMVFELGLRAFAMVFELGLLGAFEVGLAPGLKLLLL